MPRKTKAQKEKAALARTSPPLPQPQTTKRAKTSHEPMQNAADAIPQFTTSAPLQERRKPGHPIPPPPPPAPSVPSSMPLLPPQADDAKLREKYDIHTVNVAGSSKIESKVRNALGSLRRDDGKKAIVALMARSDAANKCISIAEIAKREFVKEGEGEKQVWQYTGCWTRVETVPGKKEQESEGNAGEEGGEAQFAEGEDAFESIQIPKRKMVRNTTCMVIYLSTEPVARLKEMYGEQVHELDKT